MMKVCHVSSAHLASDIRIFQKECVSLARNGYDVHLVISGKSEKKSGVKIHGIGEMPANRFKRIFFYSKKAYNEAKKVDADIYHFHDPELLPYAVKMKRKGKKVVFDSHENIIDIFADKKYIPQWIRYIFEPIYKLIIGKYIRKSDLIITVDCLIEEKLRKYNKNTVLVSNYPQIDEILVKECIQKNNDKEYICFAGGIVPQWNHLTTMKAAYKVGIKYVLCGMDNENYVEELQSYKEWEAVDYRGVLSHEEVMMLLKDAMAGVAVIDYSNNTNWTQGTLGNTKIFEIMMSGIPLICTKFMSWKKIVDEAKCGICVEPKNIDDLVKSLNYIKNHREEAKAMGERGQKKVLEKYNWSLEEQKLLYAYKCLT